MFAGAPIRGALTGVNVLKILLHSKAVFPKFWPNLCVVAAVPQSNKRITMRAIFESVNLVCTYDVEDIICSKTVVHTKILYL